MPTDEPPSPRPMPSRPIPPRTLPPRHFLMGRNRDGHWVVQDQGGMWGGIFLDRTAALKFALSENGHPHAVIMIPHPFELDLGAASRPAAAGAAAPSLQRAA
jgi:hypothetical protein